MNLNELRDKAYQCAIAHGWHDKELSNEHCLCLVISELMEAVEADRKGSMEEELADACIRLFDLAGLRNISIDDFSDEIIYELAECCNNETFTESIYTISTIPIRFEYEL